MDLSGRRGRGDGEEGGVPDVPLVAVGVGGLVAGGGGGGPNPNSEELVTAIMAMGINREDALLAVRQTGGVSVEAAISWVFENQGGPSDARLEEEGIYQEYKMVFVVNGSLPMSIGKVATQVGHASIDLYQLLVSKQEDYGGPLLQWNENGSKKIALRGETTEELVELATKADEAGLPNTCIRDAGLTEIPGGSLTVLGIFGASNNVDKVTGRLKLL